MLQNLDIGNFVEGLLDVFPMPCFYKDTNGRYQGCNQLFSSRILGLSKEEIYNRGIKDFFKEIPDDLAQRYISQDNRLFEEQGLQVYESQVLCSDKQRYLFRFIKACLIDDDAKVIGLLGFMVDLECQLEPSSLYLRDDKSIELGKKAETIVHEIVNPLMVVQNILKKISRTSKDQNSDEMKTIYSEAQRGLKSIEYISDITKWVREMSYESHTAELKLSNTEEFKDHEINSIIKQALDVMKHQIIGAGIEVNFPNFGKTKNLSINCQRTQITQVLINLLKNAKDALNEIEEKWISVQLKQTNTHIQIKIVDSGPGVPEALVKRIFECGVTTKKRGQGSGIGLGLCQKIMNSHQGSISLEDEAKNTTFTISLALS